jgi:hypothetical protein
LLVGNFVDSHVSAFDLNTGQFLGQLSDAQGNPLTLNGGVGGSGSKGLWGIAFGNGHGGTDPNALYFAAGINAENDGLFGKVTMADGGQTHGFSAMLLPMQSSNGMQLMQSSNGMQPPVSGGQMESQVDAFFRMLDAELLSLESALLSRMPNLDGMIQSFNAMATMVESAIAGQPINDLSGKV